MFSPMFKSYPVHSPLEGVTKPATPTGIDLYSRFALAGALGVSSRVL